MFTGLIEEVGRIVTLTLQQKGLDIQIAAEKVVDGLSVDDSVAVDGVCLTVIARTVRGFHAQAVAETMQRTTLKSGKRGKLVNLERALLSSRRLGGHLVQGHVDGVGEIVEMAQKGEGKIMTVRVPVELIDYIVPKGSIAFDGVSLTVVNVFDDLTQIWLIPHTLANTTLGQSRVGELLNVEVDIIGKYVAHLLHRRGFAQNLSEDLLKEWGF